MKKVTISKQDAVFWMDRNGDWQNEHGRIEHPLIIKHFNRSIKKDDKGFYLFQVNGDVEEKVYFRYEETALFARDLVPGKVLALLLNSGEKLELKPENLFVAGDDLFLENKGRTIKFQEGALLKISRFINEKQGTLFIKISGKSIQISERLLIKT